jgi:peptidoglycan hydrolase-like protein with peptidoglycan-binding domain
MNSRAGNIEIEITMMAAVESLLALALADGEDLFGSPATVTQAQIVLRDLGYHAGAVNGRLTSVMRAAIAAFQRDERLARTGYLDRATLERLGLIAEGGHEVMGVSVASADTALHVGDTLSIRIEARNPLGLQLCEERFRRRDVLHVYVRGTRHLGSHAASSQLDVTLGPDEWHGVSRIVIHGSDGEVAVELDDLDRLEGASCALSSIGRRPA